VTRLIGPVHNTRRRAAAWDMGGTPRTGRWRLVWPIGPVHNTRRRAAALNLKK